MHRQKAYDLEDVMSSKGAAMYTRDTRARKYELPKSSVIDDISPAWTSCEQTDDRSLL